MSIVIKNGSGIKYVTTVEMVTAICYKCAVPFSMPVRLKEYFVNTQENFYCPNGHDQAYVKSRETILREQLEKEKRQHEEQVNILKRNIQWAQEQRDNVIKERTVLKGQVTKIKNRIKNGVCPCCNRQFKNLASHMETKHPDFKNTQP